MTDSTGCFHLEDVPTGRYYLVGSYVGYGETQSEMFIVGMVIRRLMSVYYGLTIKVRIE